MSTEPTEQLDMTTQPIKEHAWLQQLVGEWRIESEMIMEPGGEKHKSQGTSSVRNLGGLWAVAENNEEMPGGMKMVSTFALGYDVTFKEYRGCLFSSASSHLWKYTGELSADGKTMTLNCEGPSMTEEEGTALYKDVIELIDENHRTWKSYGQDKDGEWQLFMESDYYRV